MFTPSQFAQLAAVAWSGPAAAITTSASTVVLVGGHSAIYYSVCYALQGGSSFHSPAVYHCPFAAIVAALHMAHLGGALSWWQVTASMERVSAQEAAAAGAPTITCAACGEPADLLQQCACCYVPMQAARFAHV